MPYKDRSNSDLAQLDRHGSGNTTIIGWWVQSPSEITFLGRISFVGRMICFIENSNVHFEISGMCTGKDH